MTVVFYTTSDSPIVADKALTTLATKTGTPTTDININTPVLAFSYDSTIAAANYAYIQDFGKYYFLKTPVLTTDGRMIFTFEVDVLKTYYNSLKQCNATVIRSQSIGSNDVPDSRLPVNPNSVDVVSVMSSKSFNKYSAVTSGGSTQLPVTQIVLITGRGKE